MRRLPRFKNGATFFYASLFNCANHTSGHFAPITELKGRNSQQKAPASEQITRKPEQKGAMEIFSLN